MLVRCTCVSTIEAGIQTLILPDPECGYLIHSLEATMERED